jgi:S-DNA-T family DNA segregation ATPase FtsK/SpoIIIE
VDESVVVDAVAELRELYATVERREGRLAELGAKKLTRTITEKHPDMRPIVAVSASAMSCSDTPTWAKRHQTWPC